MILGESLLAALLVMVVSLIGVVTTLQFARRVLEARLHFLVSFSAGVFLVTAGALALEVVDIITNYWIAGGLILAGYLVAWGLHALLPETHHHHDADCHRTHGGARKLLIGDGIHNLTDGIVLVAAFLVSPILGLAVTVSVVIHETLQELSEYFVLRQAGYSAVRALSINFLVSSTILVGVLLGYYLIDTYAIEGVLLAVSSGFFLQVVAHDLWPTRQRHETVGRLLTQLGMVAVGIVLMVAVNWWVGDTHVHGGATDDHAHEEHDHADEHEHDDAHDDTHEEHEHDEHTTGSATSSDTHHDETERHTTEPATSSTAIEDPAHD